MNKRQLNALSRATLVLQAKNQLLTEKIHEYKRLIVELKADIQTSENDVEVRRLHGRELENTLLEIMKRKKLKCVCESNVFNCQNDMCVKLKDIRLENIKRENSESD